MSNWWAKKRVKCFVSIRINFRSKVGPIFMKYVFNLLAISLLSVIVSPSTLNKHGMCFLMLFLFVIDFIIFHVFFISFLYLSKEC